MTTIFDSDFDSNFGITIIKNKSNWISFISFEINSNYEKTLLEIESNEKI